MRRWALIVFTAGACGTPEQLLRVTAVIETFDGSLEPQTLNFEADDGLSSEGCGDFGVLKGVQLTTGVPLSFDVLRAETIGPKGTDRCFRLNWRSRSMLTFGPVAHDLRLPQFTIWPEGGNFAGDSFRKTAVGVTFHTLPFSYLRKAVDEFDVLPPRHLVEVFDDRGVLAWRLFEGDALAGLKVGGNGVSAVLVDPFLEDHKGTARGGAFRVGRTYVLDSLGRPNEMRFEYRLVTNDVPVMNFSPSAPQSRGAPCGGYDRCPFTDGDFTVVPVGKSSIVFDLTTPREITQLFVRGLWAEPPTASLDFEVSSGAEPLTFQHLTVPLDDQVRLMNRDGALGPGRIDVQILTGRPMRHIRMKVLDAAGEAVPITRLAEVSFY